MFIGDESMLSEKMFKYYTSPKFTIESSYWDKVQDRLEYIEDLAEDDVANQRKLRDKDEFKNNEEYQIYLLSVCNFAWADKLGTSIERPITE